MLKWLGTRSRNTVVEGLGLPCDFISSLIHFEILPAAFLGQSYAILCINLLLGACIISSSDVQGCKKLLELPHWWQMSVCKQLLQLCRVIPHLLTMFEVHWSYRGCHDLKYWTRLSKHFAKSAVCHMSSSDTSNVLEITKQFKLHISQSHFDFQVYMM